MFLILHACQKSSRSTMTWKENLPHINKYFSFSFISTSPAIRMSKWVHVWRQHDNKVSTWCSLLHRIERVFELLPLIYHCYTRWIDFRLQTSLICKRKKSIIMWEMVARRCSAKHLFYKFLKIHKEIPVQQYLSNTVKSFHTVRLATFLKKDLLTGVWDNTVRRSSRK